MVANNPAPIFKYPNDVATPPFDKWIRFDAMTGRHILRKVVGAEINQADRPLGSVVLYLTESSLKSTIAVNWEKSDLGTITGAVVQQTARTGNPIKSLSLGQISDRIVDMGKGAASLASAQGLAVGISAVFADLSKALDSSVLPAVETIAGAKLNPRTDLLFNTQEYRTFSMEFVLIPRNLEEAQSIDQIIEFFQFYMLPKFTGEDFLIGYPYEFNIGLFQTLDAGTQKIKSVSQIGRSVVTSVTVDHAAAGKVSFIGDRTGAYPTATNLTIEFQEVQLRDPRG
jgi:hypothetical protein